MLMSFAFNQMFKMSTPYGDKTAAELFRDKKRMGVKIFNGLSAQALSGKSNVFTAWMFSMKRFSTVETI